MPQNIQLLVLLLLIVLGLVVVLGVWGLFLPANSQARIRRTNTGRANGIAGHNGERLGHRSKLDELEGFSLFTDSPWPELHFDMEVEDRRFYGIALAVGGALVALIVLGFYPVASDRFLLALLLSAPITVSGIFLGLSSIARWQSRIVLEAERLILYPSFGRPPRIVNYDQICYVGTASRGPGVAIRYYPLMYGGQIDLTRLNQLDLPSITQNDGLHLALQARMSGPSLDRRLELAFLSKHVARGFAVLAILLGVVLIGAALKPENHGQLWLAFAGLAEIVLVFIVVVIAWPERRK